MTALTVMGVSNVLVAATLSILPAAAQNAPTGAMPGDDAMTCEQIAAELAPYVQQMMASMAPLMQTQQEVLARAERRQAEALPKVAAMTAAATAAHADPTGVASRAVGQTEVTLQKEEWMRAEAEDKPLNEKYKAQAAQVTGDSQRLQSNARLQALMQLAQQKNCDRK